MTAKPDEHLPLNIGLSDEIIGLDRWPGCLCDYYFDDRNGAATLFVEIVFDRSRYESTDTSPPTSSATIPTG